jgi:hypothetical protein
MGLGFEDTESRHALRAASCSLQPEICSLQPGNPQPAAGKSAACHPFEYLFDFILAYASNFVSVSHSLPWLELDYGECRTGQVSQAEFRCRSGCRPLISPIQFCFPEYNL